MAAGRGSRRPETSETHEQDKMEITERLTKLACDVKGCKPEEVEVHFTDPDLQKPLIFIRGQAHKLSED